MPLNHLSTKEDFMHLHKILGSLCLIHFVYRFSNLLIKGNMNFDESNKHFILIHLALSISSLVFKISQRRHSKLPIIYPEMRLHTIVFTTRSVICFYLFEKHIIYRIIICILTNLFADLVTYFLQKGTTIRNITLYEGVKDEKAIKRYYSSSQLGATLFMLGNRETIFLPLLAIQMAAFTMTLVKKNIISAKLSHLIYAWCLWLNYFPLLFSSNILFRTIVFKKIAEKLRFDFNLDKYILWGFIFSIYLLLDEYKINNYIYLNVILISIGSIKKAYEIVNDF